MEAVLSEARGPGTEGAQRPWDRREPLQGLGKAGNGPESPAWPSLPQGRFGIEHEQSVSLNINRDVVWNSNES